MSVRCESVCARGRVRACTRVQVAHTHTLSLSLSHTHTHCTTTVSSTRGALVSRFGVTGVNARCSQVSFKEEFVFLSLFAIAGGGEKGGVRGEGEREDLATADAPMAPMAHLCVCVCVCVRMRVCACENKGVFSHSLSRLSLCVCAFVYVCICVCVFVCVCVRAYVFVYSCMHPRVYACTHVPLHVEVRQQSARNQRLGYSLCPIPSYCIASQYNPDAFARARIHTHAHTY